MICSLKDHVKHDKANKKYTGNFVKCPLFNGRYICYWCCLHISDIAEPAHRSDASEKHPDYYNYVTDTTGREWDEVWTVCSRCSK